MEGTQIGDALGLQQLGIVSAAGGVDDLAGLLIGGEGPGQGGHGHLRLQVGQHAGGVGAQVGAAHGDVLHALGAVAAGQGVVGKYVDHHVAAGALLHQIGKVVGHQRVDLGVGSVDRHGQVDFLIFAVASAGRLGAAAAGQTADEQGSSQQRSGN